MADLSLGPFTVGIDNVSPDTTLHPGAVRDAVNVDFDRSGGIASRGGRRRIDSTAGMHSLWTSREAGISFCVKGGAVGALRLQGDTLQFQSLYTLLRDEPVSFDDFLGRIAFTNSSVLGVIDVDGSARRLGLDTPAAPGVTIQAGLDAPADRIAGQLPVRFGFALSIVDPTTKEESGLSLGTYVSCIAGSTAIVSGPANSLVYMTGPGGKTFRLAGTPGAINTAIKPTKPANNRYLQRMIGGSIVRYWNGRLWVARGSTVYRTQSMRYGLYKPTADFMQFPGEVVMLEPVTAGLYVGVRDDGIYFVRAEPDDKYSLRRTGARAPIAGISTRVAAGELGGLGEGVDQRGELYALWLARNGFVIGTAEGRIIEVQRNRIRLPAAQWTASGALAIHDRHAIAVLS